MRIYSEEAIEKAITYAIAVERSDVIEIFESLDRAPWWEQVDEGYQFRKGEPYRVEDGESNHERVSAADWRNAAKDIQLFRDTRWTPPEPPIKVGDLIETVEDLERLPEKTLLASQNGRAWQKFNGYFFATADAAKHCAHQNFLMTWGPFEVVRFVGGESND